MRLDLNSELKKQLDNVRKQEPHVYGRGHGETVRFLLQYYRDAGPLKLLAANTREAIIQLCETLDEKIQASMTRTFAGALTTLVTTLLEPRLLTPEHKRQPQDAKRTPASSDRQRPDATQRR